jgi:uncharacterized damage-inducible protein DinB
MTEIQRILDQLQRAFEGNAWHGPSVRELLNGVSAAQAAGKAVPDGHSIWEIVLHMAVWQDVARRRLAGETIVSLPPELDWPAVDDASETAWRQAVTRLNQSQQKLQQSISQLTEDRLAEIVPGMDYSVYVMLHGVIQHDLYHAGQIALLKKLASRS